MVCSPACAVRSVVAWSQKAAAADSARAEMILFMNLPAIMIP